MCEAVAATFSVEVEKLAVAFPAPIKAVRFDTNGDRTAITGAVTSMPGGAAVRADVLQSGDGCSRRPACFPKE